MLLFKSLFVLFTCLNFLFTFKLNSSLTVYYINTSIIGLQNGRNSFSKNKRSFSLYGVPKKKSSHRRTRRRKVAWMKKNPAKLYRTSSYDIDEIMRYTDRKLTAHFTTRDNWLNLPSTTLINDFFLFREIRN
ncbi:conserved Plasmodium protein, unknown function [Plasmodium gallinaceum]|uniref:Uncharacterized protein n=1 Tax=Plasmodium gallinaceum TaxID=5849 RepID=A0A1J1GPS8_PLAGA|nr:conserved Plasmodium protein, unknown function [Plasmodium gallinaceum]CRG93026.1 conserved Plasmodium protein, unknown function [Plasmodium gallinaceum]